MKRMAWLLVPLLVVGMGAKKPKKKKKKGAEEAGPTVGWYSAEGWLGQCYFPPDFDAMGGGDRRIRRQDVLQAMQTQWRGERDDGIQFDEVVITNLETVLLGHPDKIEGLATANFDQCKAAMTGKGTEAWKSWLISRPRKLMEGECRRPLDATMFYYLDIGVSWQFQAPVCDENVVRITATATDEYRVDDDGPWVNATGDTETSTLGNADYPCSTESCYAGQLIMRFRGDSGTSLVKPVGTELIFDPPEHGTIEITVNDTSYFNNVYRVVSGIQHHTSVTYEPVE